MQTGPCNITILCANYNNAPYLTEFFKSIYKSTSSVKEIVIVDDCSTDNSVNIIKSMMQEYNNILLIELDKNIGFANALNEGLKHSTGKYVLRIDPDDVMYPTRIEKQYEFMLQNPQIDILGSNVAYFKTSTDNIVGNSNFPETYEIIIDRYRNGTHGLVHGSVLMKKDILNKTIYRQEYVPAEEYDLFSRLLKHGYIAHNLLEPLTFVRIHNNSISNNLPYSTVAKTFFLKNQIWNLKTSKIFIWKEYLSRSFYRKGLSEDNFITKLFYYAIASIFNPSSFIKRITSHIIKKLCV